MDLLSSFFDMHLIALSFSMTLRRAVFSSWFSSASFVVIPMQYTRILEMPGSSQNEQEQNDKRDGEGKHPLNSPSRSFDNLALFSRSRVASSVTT
jgi:hypothetical protein